MVTSQKTVMKNIKLLLLKTNASFKSSPRQKNACMGPSQSESFCSWKQSRVKLIT